MVPLAKEGIWTVLGSEGAGLPIPTSKAAQISYFRAIAEAPTEHPPEKQGQEWFVLPLNQLTTFILNSLAGFLGLQIHSLLSKSKLTVHQEKNTEGLGI